MTASGNFLMHPRNDYRYPPDFRELANDYPCLSEFLISCDNGKSRIDFKNPKALRTLTEILLHKDFGLSVKIPENSLIPTIPQRLNYILWIEDLIEEFLPPNNEVFGIDIGTGPCSIFSLLGAKKNGWHFIATEVNEKSILCAEENIRCNGLQNMIKVVKTCEEKILEDVCADSESMYFDFCMCNPPFFGGPQDSGRKKKLLHNPQRQETVTEGGDVAFVKKFLDESLVLQKKVRIFSSMLGRKCSFIQMIKALKSKGIKYRWCEFSQGKTKRWGIAWTFATLANFEQHFQVHHRGVKVQKPDFSFTILSKDSSASPLKSVDSAIRSLLHKFQVSFKVMEESDCETQLWILSYKNSWTYNRKKRREIQRNMTTNTSYDNSVTAQITPPKEMNKKASVILASDLKGESSTRCSVNPVETSKFESTLSGIQPLFSCKLVLTLSEGGVKVQFARAGCSNSNALYQFFQTFKNLLVTR